MSCDATRERVLSRLIQAITPLGQAPVPVHIWNDESERKLDDVIAMFECASLLANDMPSVDYNSLTDNYHKAMKTQMQKSMAQAAKPWAKFMFPDAAAVSMMEKLNASTMQKLIPWEEIFREPTTMKIAA